MERQRLVLAAYIYRDSYNLGLLSHIAPYYLRNYLEQFDEVTSLYDMEVVPVPARNLVPLSVTDLHFEQTLYSILRTKPHVVAFSLHAWSIAESTLLATWLRIHSPGTLLLAGGPEVAERPDFVRQFPQFDVLVEGAGDLTLRKLLVALAQGHRQFPGLPGVSWRTPDGYLHNDGPGQPDQVHLQPSHFTHSPDFVRRSGHFFTSQGCTRGCLFCQNAHVPYQARDPQVLGQEMAELLQAPEPRIFLFDYDLFDVMDKRPDLWEAVFEPLQHHPTARIAFWVTPAQLTAKWLSRCLEQWRVDRIVVGTQSMNPATLKEVGRGWSIPALENFKTVPPEYRPHIVPELMYPLPHETPQTLLAGLDSLIEQGYVRHHLNPVSVFRGTGLWRRAAKLGIQYLPEPPYMVYQTPTFTPQERLEAGTLATLLQYIGDYVCKLPALRTQLARMWTGTPRVASTLRSQLAQGATLDELLLQVVESARHFNGESVELPPELPPPSSVWWLHKQEAPKPQPTAATPAASPQSSPAPAGVAREYFPSVHQLRKALALPGITLGPERLEGSHLFVTLRSAAGQGELELFPGHEAGQAFAQAGVYKIAYRGHDSLAQAAAALARFIREAGSARSTHPTR